MWQYIGIIVGFIIFWVFIKEIVEHKINKIFEEKISLSKKKHDLEIARDVTTPLEGEIAKLQIDITFLNGEVDILKNDVSSGEEEISRLEDIISDLKMELIEIKSNIKK